ncbi:hypothetical protein PsYK624_168310 [Phanerochaete sordida]|uniref:Thioester reductase (TE) domain-containing protein n=1 Tax=Phanerochaete sordida TaxID=48140 RepID=A0A9P3GS75_9APHY|nr:hypothetical protein PsYK624_168310 [Phanerochaete sordida]
MGEAHLTQVAQTISPNLVFEHPTICMLTSFLNCAADTTLGEHSPTPSGVGVADIAELTVHKCTEDLPEAKAMRSASQPAFKVLLTSSMGNIGSHIFTCLLDKPCIACMYTLDRPSVQTPPEQLKGAFAEQALPVDVFDDPRGLLPLPETWELGLATGDEIVMSVMFEHLRRFFEQHFQTRTTLASGSMRSSTWHVCGMSTPYATRHIPPPWPTLRPADGAAASSGGDHGRVNVQRPADTATLYRPLSAAFECMTFPDVVYDAWCDTQTMLAADVEQWGVHAVQSVVWNMLGVPLPASAPMP